MLLMNNASQLDSYQQLSFGKTFLECFQALITHLDAYLQDSLVKGLQLSRQGGNGRTLVVFMDPSELSPGASLMLNISDSPNDASGSGLSQVLEQSTPSKYYLSKIACQGVLRRAESRGKTLPESLKTALLEQTKWDDSRWETSSCTTFLNGISPHA